MGKYTCRRLMDRVNKGISLALCVFLITPNIAFAGQIVVDGSTQTVVAVSGDTTDITTSTLLGQNAFNSFTRFNVDTGETVNLHVPSVATNLLNLVHGDTSTINGILNSVKDGSIGGNVFFLNPHGLIVGTEGSINVGSLTVVTPTPSFMDSFFTAPGAPAPAAVSAVLEGRVPLTESGLISVKGRVNAVSDINLAAGDVHNSGSISSGAAFVSSSVNFSDVVNIGDLGGDIEISAASDFTNEGLISVDGSSSQDGGTITISAGNNITLTGRSLVSARGHGRDSAGGSVKIVAGHDALFDSGIIDVRGGEISGDGGFVEFSGTDRVTLAGGVFKAAANSGQAGSILIDPNDIEILSTNQLTDGASFSLIANNSITVGDSVIISTRNIADLAGDHLTDLSEGDSGRLVLQAPQITVGDGAMLLAQAINGSSTAYNGGDIELTAAQTDSSALLAAAAAAKITIGAATLKGDNISLSAVSNAEYEWSGLTDLLMKDMSAKLGSTMVGVNVAVAQAEATSEVVLSSGAVLEAAGDIDLIADASASATTDSKHKTTQDELGIGFVYGEIDSTATVDVQDGATIRASNLSVEAKNTGTLDIKVQALSEESKSGEAAVAVTFADVTSLAQIASGAIIETSDDLSVSAVNTNSFSTTATAKAREEAIAGIAATIFTANTSAQAINDADLVGLDNLTIAAYDNTIKNITNASAVTGGTETFKTIKSGASSAGNFIKQKMGSAAPQLNQNSGTTEGPKLAGAVSIADVTQTATARIGDSAQVEAAEDVVVAAQTRDAEVQNKAESSVKSKATADAATYALSAAVAYSDYEHNAEAYLGADSQVSAERVGVRSDVLMPYGEKWSKLAELDNIIEDISLITDAIGAPLLTGFANATGAAEDLAISGSVNYMDITNNSAAYLGQGARVTLLPTDTAEWETTLPNESILNWQAPLAVTANTDVTGVFAAGNINFTLAGAGGDPGAASVGGAYNQVNYHNTTRSYIAGGARVDHSGAEAEDIAVTATTNETAIAIGPTSGRGGAYGLSGMFSMADIDSTTEAFVSNKANVAARNLLVNAAEDVVVWSLTGAFNKSESAGVGATVAMNDITTTTRAYVGAPADDSEETLPSGQIEAEAVNVQAVTDGRIEAISVAAAMAGSNPPKNEPGFMDKAKNKLLSAIGKANSTVQNQSSSSEPATEPKFGLAVSGNASINIGALTTEAYVQDAMLNLAGEESALAIRALNNTYISAAGGSAALAKAKKDSSKFSAAIAGSVAVNDLSNRTSATLSDSQVTGANDVRVQALAAGQQLAIAIGTAVNASADQDKAASAAGSVSLNFISNEVTSEVQDSVISGSVTGTDRVLDVTAYDRTKVGTGGGSLIYGGKAGIGAAVSYTEMSNIIGAYLSGSTVSNYDVLRVQGLSAAKIGAGAGMAGFATKKESNTLGGAVVISTIANQTTAQVTDNSTVNVTGDVSVLARDTKGVDELDQIIAQAGEGQIADGLDFDGSEFGESAPEDGTSIISVAGIAQASGNNVGISFTWNEINNDFSAVVADSEINTSGDVAVNAHSGTKILGLSVGAGLATGKFAGAASVTVNEIGGLLGGHNITAEVTNSTISADDVSVEAKDNSRIDSLAGQVTVSIGKVSVGGAIAHNQISKAVGAKVQQGSEIAATGSTLVDASNDSIIRTLSAAGGGSAGFAFNGSVSSAHISNTTNAEILGSTVDSAGEVSVLADDESEIDSLAGAASFSKSAAVGGAIAVNTIINATKARIDDSTLDIGSLLTVQGTNTSTIRTLAAAVAGASNAAVTGSVSDANIANTTEATVTNSDLFDYTGKTASAILWAEDDSLIESLSGGAAASSSAAVGGAVSVNTVTNATKAYLDNSNLSLSGRSGVVYAINSSSIRTLAAAVGASNSAAVNGSATTSVISNTTEAYIDSSTFLSPIQIVDLYAVDRSEIESLAGSISLSGSAAVGGAAAVNVIANTARARLSGSTIRATENVLVDALNGSTINTISVAGSGAGTAAVNGSLTGSDVTNTTEAIVEDSTLSVSAGNASVTAIDESEINALAGSVTGSGSTAVGGAAAVNIITNTTRAQIDGGAATIGGSLLVNAANSSLIKAMSVAGGASGSVAVNGSATTSVVTNTTETEISGAELSIDGNTSVVSSDESEIDSLAGSVSGSGTAAVGGAVAVSTIINTTKARMTEVDYLAIGSLALEAKNDSIIQTVSVAGGGSGTATVTGSDTTSVIKNTTEAELVNTDFAEAADSVSVSSSDASTIRALAGNAGFSGTAAVGGALSANVIANTTAARVSGGFIDVNGTSTVQADNSSLIENISVSGAGSGTAAITGSIATSHIMNTTEAEVVSAELANAENEVSILATDDSTIRSVSGGAAVSGAASVGAAASVNRIANTTRASLSGGSANVGSLLVKGASNSTMESLAVGLGGSVTVGVAGSTAVNLIDSDTVSYIDSGATVVAQDNVGVQAETHDVVRNAAGSAGIGFAGAGVGASVAVNTISGSTKAYISGADTKVTALALDPAQKMTVASGNLSDDVDLGSGLDLDTYMRADLAALQQTEEVSGVAVNAAGTHSIENVVVNVGGGLYAGVAGTVSVNHIGGDTQAHIDGAQATSGDALSVKSSDYAYGHSFIGSVGIGAAGVGIGSETTIFGNTTRAYISGSNPIEATGGLVIDAQSTQGASSMAASGAAGVVGAVGTGTVGIFTGTTEAYLQSAPVNVGSLSVNAEHDGRLFVAAGGATVGAVALAGTFTVGVDQSTTRAYVADTTVETTGEVEVNADNSSEIRSTSVSGSVAGSFAVAGSVLVSLTSNTTSAYVTNSQIGSSGVRADNLSVTATDSVLSENLAGAVGIGVVGGGAGASAAVVKVDNSTSAYIEDSTVYTENDVVVDSQAKRDISTIAASGGVSLAGGIGGTAAVTLIGSELAGDIVSELNRDGNGTLSQTETLTQGDRLTEGDNIETGEQVGPTREDTVTTEDDRLNNIIDSAWSTVSEESDDTTVNSGLTGDDLTDLNASGKVSVTAQLNPDDLRLQTTALIVDSNVTAGQDVRVKAAEKLTARIDAGALGLGIGNGIGGASGIMDVTTNVTSAIQGSSNVTAEKGVMEISAEAGSLDTAAPAVQVNTYQGSGGIVSLGAAISEAYVTSNITAQASTGTTLTNADTTGTETDERLTIEATDNMDIESSAYGASIGFVPAGLVDATSTKDGSTQALLDAAQVNLASGLLRVNSTRTGKVSAYSLAGSGGVISASGSLATATETGKIKAWLGDDVVVDGSDSLAAVQVRAESTPQVDAEAVGVSLSVGANCGGSGASATASTEVSASVGSNADITAKKLAVEAVLGVNGTAPSARGYATASGGGFLFGFNATTSNVTNESTVTSSIGTGSRITVGTTSVSADADTKQVAESTAVNGGIIAVGGNFATATSNTVVNAYLANEVDVSGQQLSVAADGTDDNFAKATAGSGGIVSGSAAVSETSTTGSTTASVGSGALTRDILVEDFDLTADHITRFNAQTDSINAAVVGASGSIAKNTVNYSVLTDISQNAVIYSKDINIGGSNSIIKDWLSGYNVTSGSGGAVDAAAASSTTTISNDVNINIGDNALLHVYGDRKSPGHLVIYGKNSVIARDKVKLDSGGAISVALAESKITNDHNNAAVSFGTGAQLESVGDIDISVRTNTDIQTISNVKTYGGAGAAQGETVSSATVNNSIGVGSNVSMLAAGDINLRAGNNRADAFNAYTILANTDLWNKTVIPIETKPKADAYLKQSNTIALGAGSDLRSVGHIRLLTEDGTQDVRGYGVGKDLYRQALEEIGQFFSDLIGGGDVSLEIKGGSSTNLASSGIRVDGTVRVGIENQRYLTIDEYGNIDEEHTSDGITIKKTDENLANDIQGRLDEVNKLLAVMPDGGASSAGPEAEQEVANLTAEKTAKTTTYSNLSTEHQTLVDQNAIKDGQISANEARITEINTLLKDPDLTDVQKTALINERGSLFTANAQLTLDINNNVARIQSIDTERASLTTRIGEINTRLEELAVILANSDGDGTSVADLKARYQAEKVMLLAQLAALGDETPQVINTTDDITAKSSNIYVKGDTLTGQGDLLAPGDTKIHIINNSANFLRIKHELTIPDEAGGHIYFNDVSVTNNAEINLRNFGTGAQFGQILTSDNTTPEIIVKNAFIPAGGERAPDLFIDANVRNRNGLVQLTSAYGSVQIMSGVDVLGETIKVSAGRDIFVGYKTGFRHVGGDVKSRWSSIISGAEDGGKDTTDNRTPGSILEAAGIPKLYEPSYIAGNNIFMSAQYLNINGIIQSGIPMRNLVIPESIQAEIDAYQAKFDNGDVTEAIYKGLSINSGVEDDPAKIPVFYNAVEGRLELAPVMTMGGYMEFYGHILNTGVGELRVMDGYGKIDITNNTNSALALSTIDTGSGIEGTIKITDTAKRVTVDGQDETAPLVTVIKRLGNTIKVFDNDNGTGEVSLSDSDAVSTVAGRSTQYNPLASQYYSWTARDRATWTEEYSETKKTRFFFWGSSSDTSVSPITSKNREPQTQIGADVVRVVSGHNETYWYDRKYYISHTGWDEVDYDTAGTWGVWYDETWTYNRTATETIIHNHNVYASNPIKINFLGEDTGSLTVNSVGNIVIDGQLKNTAGNTLIHSNGAILQGTNEWAQIRGEHINLTAGSGIGTANRLVQTDLLDSGELRAVADNGSIYLNEIKGDLIFNEITAAAGNVNLTAESGMVGKDVTGSEARIKGNQVNLRVEHGGIGTANNTVEVDSAAVQSGGLNATAASDIYVVETAGDLFVGKVESTGGDISLTADNGNIIDNNQVQTEDTRVKQDLLDMWDEMGLTGEGAEASAAQTVSAYERMKGQEYKTYWQYRQRFLAQDGSVLPYDASSAIEFSEAEVAYYHTELGWSDSEITALENKMTLDYHAYHHAYGSIGAAYDADWSYSVTAAEREELVVGASWTEKQLENSIGIGVLKEVSDTRIWIEDPNVAGRDISLWASGSIGRDMTSEPFIVNIAGRTWSDLTEEEKLMILSAERANITFTSNDEIKIIPRDAVDVQASGTVTATVEGGNIYLGSETDINLKSIRATGDVEIKSRQSIINAANPGEVNIVGQDAILEAAQGSIGESGDAVLIDLGSGVLTARAGDDIYLESADDDLNIDTIYAVHHVELVTPKSIFNATNPDRNIRSESLNLQAMTGSIGNDLHFVKIGLDPTGSLTAEAAGDIYINSPQHSLRTSKITAGGDITFFGGDNLYIESELGGISTTLGNVLIDVTGSVLDGDDDESNGITAQDVHLVVGDAVGADENELEIDTLSQGLLNVSGSGGVYLTETSGDINIEHVFSEFGGIRLKAEGNIFGTTSETDISGVSIDLIALTGSIGEADNHLLIDSSTTDSGTVSASAAGNIYVTEVDGDLNLNRFAATAGDIEVVAHGSILDTSTGDSVNFEGQDITLTSETGQIGADGTRIVTAASGITNIFANSDIYLEERYDDLDSDYITSETGSVDIYAPDGSIRIDTLRAYDLVTLLTPYDIELGWIEAGRLNLTLGGVGRLLSIDEMRIREEVLAKADNIRFANLIHTGSDAPLKISLGGGSKSMADTIEVKAASGVGIVVNEISGDHIRFDAAVDDLNFVKAMVGTRADINNSYHTVVADNVNKLLFDCNLQIFPEDNPFFLSMRSDRLLMTDARVVNYDPNYIINEFDTENSFVRITDKMPEVVGIVPEPVNPYYTLSVLTRRGDDQPIVVIADSDDDEESEVGADE